MLTAPKSRLLEVLPSWAAVVEPNRLTELQLGGFLTEEGVFTARRVILVPVQVNDSFTAWFMLDWRRAHVFGEWQWCRPLEQNRRRLRRFPRQRVYFCPLRRLLETDIVDEAHFLVFGNTVNRWKTARLVADIISVRLGHLVLGGLQSPQSLHSIEKFDTRSVLI